MQSWEVHIAGAGDKRDDFFATLSACWDEKDTGHEATWENVGGLLGKKKRMMKIEWNEYRCYIGAEAVGKDLFCTWQLYHPDFNSREAADGTFSGLFMSDFNELTEVKAFAAVTRDCAVQSAEKLFDERDLDKTNLKKPSSGVLGPL